MGLIEQEANKDKILKLVRFKTSTHLNEYVSLDEYIGKKLMLFLIQARMKEG
jgi:HSP90 family molecular chaperone